MTDTTVAAEEEEIPLSLDDLPNDVLSIVLGKLWGKDKLSFTQASPSARRLSSGPNAHPGVLGRLNIGFFAPAEAPPVALRTERLYIHDSELRLNMPHDGFAAEQAPLLSWLAAHGKAFDRVTFDFAQRRAAAVLPLTPLVASTAHTVLSALTPPTQVELRLTALDSETYALLAPFFAYLNAFKGKRSLLVRDLDLSDNSPTASSYLREVSCLSQFASNLAKGAWTADLLAKSDLEFLRVACNALTAFRPSPSWTSLRYLALQGLSNASEVVDFVGLSKLTALQQVVLRSISYGGLSRLSSLQSLPSLKFLYVEVDGDPSAATPIRPALRFEHLVSLRLSLIIEPEDLSQAVSVSCRLDSFVCPKLRLIDLPIHVRVRALPANLIVAAKIDSLAGFPSLKSLRFACRCNYSSYDGLDVTLDASSVDFPKQVPELAFLTLNALLYMSASREHWPSIPITRGQVLDGRIVVGDSVGDKKEQVVEFGEAEKVENSDSNTLL